MGAAFFSHVDTFEGCFPSSAKKPWPEKLRISMHLTCTCSMGLKTRLYDGLVDEL